VAYRFRIDGLSDQNSAVAFKDEFLGRFRWIEGHADVTGLFADGQLLAQAVEALALPFEGHGVTRVAAVEARGFVLGSGVALRLGVGFVAIRKAGSVHPGPKVGRMTAPDWRGREHLLQLQRAALGSGDVVLLVDDWAEAGSQATAAKALIEETGALYAGLSLLVDQLPDDVRRELEPVRAVVRADELPPGG
jgi:adenine phosphoribosyltransferase